MTNGPLRLGGGLNYFKFLTSPPRYERSFGLKCGHLGLSCIVLNFINTLKKFKLLGGGVKAVFYF